MKAKYKKRGDELGKIIQRVLEHMENNTEFPNPPSALADLKKLLPELLTAFSNAEGRDVIMMSIKHDKKAMAYNLLDQVAEYVTSITKGDKTLILKSGFEVVSDRRRSNQPPTIGQLDVQLGHPGEVVIRIKNVTGIKAYIHQYTTELPGANSVWVGEGSSEGIHTFQGLTSEKRYWFRVVAIGYNKQRGYSPVVSRVIQ